MSNFLYLDFALMKSHDLSFKPYDITSIDIGPLIKKGGNSKYIAQKKLRLRNIRQKSYFPMCDYFELLNFFRKEAIW
jgi:hypothetical protein